MMIATLANAQIKDKTSAHLKKDDKSGENVGNPNHGRESIRLVDNKGTIKYLQAINGITTITSTTPNHETVTTWQLGGTLVENTYIQLGKATGEEVKEADRKAFVLDGLKLVTPSSTYGASKGTDAVDGSIHSDSNTSPLKGFTVLIRNEKTGAIEKIRLADLLQVESSHTIMTIGTAAPVAKVGTDENAYKAGTITKADIVNATVSANNAGAKGVVLDFKVANIFKVQVYRNGNKLRAGIDYKIKNSTSSPSETATSVVYLISSEEETTNLSHKDPNDWKIYTNDVIEVFAIK